MNDFCLYILGAHDVEFWPGHGAEQVDMIIHKWTRGHGVCHGSGHGGSILDCGDIRL